MHVNYRLLVFKRHVGQTPAIRRPGGRDNRLLGTQRRLGVLPIRIGNMQLITIRTAFHHISDTRRKNTRFANQLLVNHIGDAMSRRAQHRGRGHKGVAGERRLLVDVVKPEARFLTIIPDRRKTTGSQCVSSTAAPIAIVRRSRFGHCHTSGVDHLEETATLKVAANHRGNRPGTPRISGKIGNGQWDAISTGTSNFDG